MFQLIFSILKFIFDFTIFFVLGPGIIIVFLYKLIIRGGLRRFFLYERKDSFFHRLDPRAKVLWATTVTMLGAILGDIRALILLFIWVIIMWIAAKPTKEKLTIAIILMLPVPFNAILYQGILYGYDWWNKKFIIPSLHYVYVMHPAMDYIIGGHIITFEGMYYGAFQSLRVLIAVGSGLLLAVATAPNSLLLGLTNFIKVKNKRIGVPYIISFALVVGIRLIPTMFEDANTIINAARIRGLTLKRFKSRNPVKALKAFFDSTKYFLYMTIPLIVSSLRRGNNLAIAADLRAFRAKPNRTYLIEREMNKEDFIFTIITTVVLILGWVYAFYGGVAMPGFVM